MPEHFVERLDEQNAIKELLLSKKVKRPGTSPITVIRGLGGLGKSTFAASLAHDIDIENHFKDGTLWVTLGQNPEPLYLLTLLSGWMQSLGDYNYKSTNLESASRHLRTLLYEKKILLVIDDVWKPEHFEPFRLGSSTCHTLVTTREANIVGAENYDLPVMTVAQSSDLINQNLTEPLQKGERKRVEIFIHQVGRLPLALELGASQINEGVTWEELLEDLQSEIARLECLNRPNPPDDESLRKKYSLLACLNLSLKWLSPEELRQFAWLGIIKEDTIFTQEIIATLWQIDPREAGSILRKFYAKSLLLFRRDKRSYRLHDLVHDMAQRLLVTPQQPIRSDDLPGLGLILVQAHRQFLIHHLAKTQKGQWHTLQDDGYIHTHLTWHMEQSDQAHLIPQLLEEEDEQGKNAWYTQAEKRGEISSFFGDITRSRKYARSIFETEPAQSLALQMRYGLMLSSINSLTGNVPGQLIARLIEEEIWTIPQALAYIQTNPIEEQKALALKAIIDLLPNEFKLVAFEIAERIKNDLPRVIAFSSFSGYHYDFFDRALCAARNITDISRKTLALGILVFIEPQLSSEFANYCIEIDLEEDIEKALKGTIQYLDQESIKKIFDFVIARIDQYSRKHKNWSNPPLAQALALTATRVNESDQRRALEAARKLDYLRRAEALHVMAPFLSDSLCEEAMDVALTIPNSHEWDQAFALSAFKTREYKSTAWLVEQSRKLTIPFQKASALIKLLEDEKTLISEIIETIKLVQDGNQCVELIHYLEPYLNMDLCDYLILSFQDLCDMHRILAIGALAKHLNKKQIQQALKISIKIQDEFHQCWSLLQILQYKKGTKFNPFEGIDKLKHPLDKAFLSVCLAEVNSQFIDYAIDAVSKLHSLGTDGYEKAGLLRKLFPLIQVRNINKILSIIIELPDYLEIPLLLDLYPILQNEFKIDAQALIDKALDSARKSYPDRNTVKHLIAIQKYTDQDLLQEAQDLIQNCPIEYIKSESIIELATSLPNKLDEALDIIPSLTPEQSKLEAFSKLAPHLRDSQLQKAIALISCIEGSLYQIEAWKMLTIFFPSLLSTALEQVNSLQDKKEREWSLFRFCHLSTEITVNLFNSTLEEQNEDKKSELLIQLISSLSIEQICQLLEVIEDINSTQQTKLIRCLIPRLDELSLLKPNTFNKLLYALATHQRQHFLSCFDVLIPIIYKWGSNIAVEQLAKSVQDVVRYWE
ncbi:NB-ARC domain-containing protein [Spirulina major CS-329]|uniref:NB-ARC domain-containing protein n=1 Tax=Spirulina TaxID=1154 RepID=UPI0023310B2E|nr:MULTISPECIES: NB-ARC domain-containing protein [Spirulina]MDB9494777.1 NB-ARC domain-containing protein [Spirulina subsalsa CS-330]MDB9503899.1 NB-ARC domain-containing protein [Spirulina major CS-329]